MKTPAETIKHLRETIDEVKKYARDQSRMRAYCNEVRQDAEKRMVEWREKYVEAANELARLKCGASTRPGGTFQRREVFPVDHELMGEYSPPGDYDEYSWKWSLEAMRGGLADSGVYCSLPTAEWHALPNRLRAESWWHLCSIIGVTEGVARLCYHHPEEGQESTVAKAKPVTPKVQIYCEGDYL